MHAALKHTEHRPWPLPRGPWVMTQLWHDLLFAHWPVDAEILRSLVPKQLPLDLWEGQCWLAVAPFHMSHIRARGLPRLGPLSKFPELNVRTYVTLDGKPGVYFFSLDAGNIVAVRGARTLYRLPYFHADMSVEEQDGWISYASQRRNSAAEFRAKYRPIADVELRQKGTLEHWLTERYCLYTVARNTVYRAEIHHQPWPLQNAETEIHANTMTEASGIPTPNGQPLLHFSKKLEVLVWPLEQLLKSSSIP